MNATKITLTLSAVQVATIRQLHASHRTTTQLYGLQALLCSVVDAIDKAQAYTPTPPYFPETLWQFNFTGGGINSVLAPTRKLAVERAMSKFPSLATQIDRKSFKPLRSKKAQDAYWNNLPLMD